MEQIREKIHHFLSNVYKFEFFISPIIVKKSPFLKCLVFLILFSLKSIKESL